LALIATLPTHHGKPPPLKLSEDGITVRQKSRALFQRHRSQAEVTALILMSASLPTSDIRLIVRQVSFQQGAAVSNSFNDLVSDE
jgi:hypothetical protein